MAEIRGLIKQQEIFNKAEINEEQQPDGEWSEKFGCYIVREESFRNVRGG